MKVSVIIPVFNKEKYLKKCLDSVVNQSLKEIEIICIDDGSTDASLRILEEYSKEDTRINIIKQSNKGPGLARNRGLDVATSEYVFFLDADDWIELNALEKVYNNAIESNSEIVLFNAVEYLPENKIKNRVYYPQNIQHTFDFHDKKDIVMNNFLIACTKLHKLDFIRKYDIRFSENGLFEDVFFHIQSMIKASRISYVNEIFYNYRRTEKNTRQTESIQSRKSFQFLDILEKIKTYLMNEGVYYDLEENFIDFKLTELTNLFNNNNNKSDFYNLLKKDFNINPIKKEILIKIHVEKQHFYINIKESENLDDYFNQLNKNNHTPVDNSLKNKFFIKNFLKKYFF